MIQSFPSRIDSATHFRVSVWQCARNFLWIISLIAAAGHACIIADESENKIQQRIMAISQNLQTATVRIRSGSDVASGVIVAGSGLVLTVAHGLKPDSNTATVLLAGGKSCEAKRIFVDEQADVALLEMHIASVADVTWTSLPVPTIDDSAKGQMVIASGYPARESDGMPPVVRLGEILAVNESLLQSSCTLTSGDSGGPLMNGYGELIGLHRQIGVGVESNEHITLAAIRRVLEKSEHWKTLPIRRDSDTLLISNDLMPTPQVRHVAQRATVEVHGNDTNGKLKLLVLGTVLNGQSVATKLSEIGACRELSCQFTDGSTITATVGKSDRTRDLAILKLARPYPDGNTPTDFYASPANNSQRCGQLVFAATSRDDISPAGVLSRISHNEPELPARFGAVLESVGQQVRIKELSPNGCAAIAGLQSGDTLEAIDTTNVSSLQVLSVLLAIRQPGDWVSLDVDRGTKRSKVRAQLQHDPGQQFEKTEFLDGRSGRVSQRRSGFKEVMQHDIAIEPSACGGPLIDIDGHIIAINIARRAREATLAVPVSDVFELTK